MGSLTALLLATPIFGFSLSAPALHDSLDLSARGVAQAAASESTVASASDDSAISQADYLAQTKRRNKIASVHRVLGISTWGAMTATVALGVMSYYNLYGFFDSRGDNPCVRGGAIGGDAGCRSLRTLHAVGAGVTTTLYAATFTLSLMMPDPDELSSGEGAFARTLRLHKTLRWVHFGGMVAQVLIGLVIANNWLGLDRANNYKTLQALATAHLASGIVTWGALSWAGALMTF
ncbi:MAG TPA: hypothetical protein VF331_08715 [Polyangiales bacterium]